jgi:PAP2 superfamily
MLPWHHLPIDLAVLGGPFALAARPRTLRGVINVLAAGLILPLSNRVMPYTLGQTSHLFTTVFDPQVIALDATLGAQPSFLVAGIFVRVPYLHSVCGAIYQAIFIPIALIAGLEAHQRRRTGIGMLPTFLVVAAIGYGCYALMPVIGPDAWFGSAFPYDIGLSQGPMPRNAMPSLHNAWVILAFLLSRGMGAPIRVTCGAWMIGTAIATLGFGEHYLLDIVVAMPFALLIRALCQSELPWSAMERRFSLLLGAFLVLAWAVVIRGAVILPATTVLAPACMLATVVVALWWERRVARPAGMVAVPVRPLLPQEALPYGNGVMLGSR